MQQLQLPPLEAGETYVGAIGDKNGNVYHVILLSEARDSDTWQAQMDWAKSIGGDLPDRVEQAMLFKHHRELFEKRAYWSNETDEDDSGYAWIQFFLNGIQDGKPQELGAPRPSRPQIAHLILHSFRGEQ